MYDYTKLKGINNFNDTQSLDALGPSLNMFFDWGLVNIGAFNNVRLSQTDIKGGDRSILKPVSDPNYQNGVVWQCPSRNLIWESGCFNNSSIPISGVYVNGTFRPNNTSGNNGFNIDYSNGRVIFNSGISTSSTVKMEYSTKIVDIKEARESPIMQIMQVDVMNLDTIQYINNSGDASILSPNKIQLPHVAMEISPSITVKPYEMGSYTEYRTVDVLFHVFTKEYSKKITDIFLSQSEKSIYLLDLDKIAKDGKAPLDYRGYKRSTGLQYPDLVDYSGGYYREYVARFEKAYVSSNTYINYNFKELVGNGINHTVIRIPVEIIKTFKSV